MGEITTDHKSSNNKPILTWYDIDFYSEENIKLLPFSFDNIKCSTKFTVKLRSSKTDISKQGVSIRISNIIPVTAMLSYVQYQSFPLSPHQNVYRLDNDSALTKSVLVNELRNRLKIRGINSSHYSGHSFRRGGATALYSAGVSQNIIDTVGRWKSDCSKMYIDININSIDEQC